MMNTEATAIREKWLQSMLQTASPVISSLAEGKLKEKLPLDFHPGRAAFAPLEAFGRTFTGIAPWLEGRDIADPKEKKLQAEWREKVIRCMDRASDPASPDYMCFEEKGERQPLVDCGFLCHGLYRARTAI